MSWSELRRVVRVHRAIASGLGAVASLAVRPVAEAPVELELEEGIRLALRGSRGVRVSDLAILEEVLVDDHYRIDLLVRPGFRVIDIGAHIGVFSLLAACRVGPKGFVLSVEASPANFALLDHNRAANPHLPLQVLNLAAAGGSGETTLCHSQSNTGGHRTGQAGGQDCRLQTIGLALLLDRMPGGEADLVKLDCEGCEFAVLEGAALEAMRRVHRMIIEFHRFQNDVDGAIEAAEARLRAARFELETISEVTYADEGYFRTVIARRAS